MATRWFGRVARALQIVTALAVAVLAAPPAGAQAPRAAAPTADAAKPAVPRKAAGPLCREVTHEGAGYVVCAIDLATHDISLALTSANGGGYGTLGAFARARAAAGTPVPFAMNAGMYHRDGRPVGLYVEGGREVRRIVLTRGPGNFHMVPNGVFYVTATGAGVMESRAYVRARPPAVYATQSGPMLVIGGKLHPRFSADGPSLKIRNGVGVRDARTVLFAISNEGVSFGAFARLFRDVLNCPDALYLDGSVSSLWAPSVGRADGLWPVGPIVTATPKPAPVKPARPSTR